MAAKQRTIKIDEKTHEILSKIAKEEEKTMTKVLGEAIHQFERHRMAEQAHKAYQDLMKDPEKWSEELRERAAWHTSI